MYPFYHSANSNKPDCSSARLPVRLAETSEYVSVVTSVCVQRSAAEARSVVQRVLGGQAGIGFRLKVNFTIVVNYSNTTANARYAPTQASYVSVERAIQPCHQKAQLEPLRANKRHLAVPHG